VNVAALATATRQGPTAAGFAGPRVRSGAYIRRPRGLGVRARGVARVEAGLVPWPGSGSSPSLGEVGDDPNRWGPPGSERERGGERWAAGPSGRERSSGAAAGLAHVGRKEEKKKKNWLGWALWEEKERGEKERVGRAKREKEGEKEMHLNVFEFKFEI
jgi:hypothetical protein